MQYILTQQEYDKLFDYAQLQDKYAKLLVFGVSINNEKLKQ